MDKKNKLNYLQKELVRDGIHLSTILSNIQDTIYRTDRDGILVWITPSIKNLLGYEVKEVLGKDLSNLYFNPLEKAKLVHALNQNAGTIKNYEVQLKHKDGSAIWASTNSHYYYDDNKNILGVEGDTRDITEQKKIEKELNHFKRTLDKILDCVFMFDAESLKFFYVNQGAIDLLGYDHLEFLDLTPLDIKPLFTEKSFREHIQPLISGEIPSKTFETIHQHKNGEHIPIEIFIQYFPEPNKAGYLVSIVRDIADRKKTEAELKLFNDLINRSNDAIFVAETETSEILYVNDKACENLQYTKEELLKKKIPEISDIVDNKNTWGEHINRLEEHGYRLLKGQHKRKDGSLFPVEVNVNITQMQGKSYIVSVVRDITERQTFEDALKSIAETTTSTRDNDFFRDSIASLAKAYNVHYAFLGIFDDVNKTTIKTIALWVEDHFAKNFTYSLEGTPCSDILNRTLELIPKNASALYPKDKELVDMGVESYFGVPLISSKHEIIGIMSLMDTKPMDIKSWTEPILRVFANRISLELERKQDEEKLKQAANVYENTREGIAVTDVNGDVLSINPAFTYITGYRIDEIINKNLDILDPELEKNNSCNIIWAALQSKGYWQGEKMDRRKNSEVYPSWLNISGIKNDAGKIINYVAVFSDITKIKESEEKLSYLAYHDPLTNLPNRLLFQDRLQQAISNAHRKNALVALLFFDLDRFKIINDTLGHVVGDMLLAAVGDRLKKVLRESDTIARIGGDEFTFILTDIHSSDNIKIIANKIMEELTKAFIIEGYELFVTASIGIACYPNDGKDWETLLKHADIAMYSAKEKGKNNYQFFSKGITSTSVAQLKMESSFRQALRKDEFELLYQPQIDLKTRRLVGAEVLTYWQHEDGVISPSDFIPIAEETGLIMELGEKVLSKACHQNKSWQNLGLDPIVVSVNLSARQFQQSNLIDIIDQSLEESKLDSSYLELELTESMLMQIEATIKILTSFKDRGIKISIDDFGTGFSSLNYLKRFPIDKLKIDRSFVKDITTDEDDAAITKAIISMGQSLRLTIIAEGVETEEQLNFLESHNCDEAQGYYFSRPLPGPKFLSFLKAQQKNYYK